MPARGIAVALTVAAFISACGGKTGRDTAGSGTGDPTHSGGFGGDATSSGGTGGGSDNTGGDVATGGSNPEASGGEDSGGVAGECPEGLTLCGDQCVDTLTSNPNCGGCDNRCYGGDCVDGVCNCPTGFDYCYSECVNLQNDWRYCGDCNTACPGGRDCVDGSCECPGEYTLCDDVCVDITIHPNHCGRCNNACPTGSCIDGLCEYGPEGPSCAGGLDCNGESCCTSILVPGGTFPMGTSVDGPDGCPEGWLCGNEQPEHEATVSSYYLDRFEVTVGRFRAFVEGFDAWRAAGHPQQDEGSHPLIANSGWDAGSPGLPESTNAFRDVLEFYTVSTLDTWTVEQGANENRPINYVSWVEAFAFCIWDGGRLPTAAEWEYAAAGGDDNRLYPWGTEPPNAAYASYDSLSDGDPLSHSVADIPPVGSTPLGNGRWGHGDLAGSLWEWVLDWSVEYTDDPCTNCAQVTPSSLPNQGDYREYRGGSWPNSAEVIRAASRGSGFPDGRYFERGFRCARSP